MPAADRAVEPDGDGVVPVPLRRRSAEDTGGEVARVLAKLEAAGSRIRLTRVLANSATGFRPFVLLTTGLLNSPHVPRRIQEIVILSMAAGRGCQYEWEEHVPMALAAGVSEDLVERIDRHGGVSDDLPLSAEELIAVGFAEDVLSGAALTGDRWDAAVQAWGNEGALDLLMTVAVWGALVPTIITGLGLRHAD